MNFDEYFSHKEKLNDLILSFLDDDEDNDENFLKLSVFQKEHIIEDRDELQLYLRQILRITSKHHRQPNFLQKIKQIIFSLEDSIKKNFTNFEIFSIFSNCKIILLFLLEKKILTIDESICRILQYKMELNFTKFCHFFYPELKPYLNEEIQSIIKEELIEISPRIFEFFEEARQKGENHSYLCQLIRNDDINEFIIYINQKNISVTSLIKPSFFETNSYLISQGTSLIEYAAFFGSIQIFQYLLLNNVELNQLIWKYAIHGKNPEIIHIIEGNDIKIIDKDFYEKCYRLSIKCHHNDIANYIKDNLLEPNYSLNKIITFHLRYLNFIDLPKKIYNNNPSFFSCLCEGNYLNLVKELFLNKEKYKMNIDFSEVFNLAAKQNSIDVLQFLSNQDNIEINHNFYIYRKLTKIEINSNLIFKPENLIFKGCSSLTQITLPSTLKKIENRSFFGCYSLLKLIIPSSVTSIGSFAFYDCLSLLEIEFPPNVIEIKKGTFYNCKSLKKIILPSILAKINDYSFFNCSSLVEITLNKESSLDDPLINQEIESISKSIGIYAFKDCTSLKKVIIPPFITMIREYAFINCQSLTNVIIPSETTFIGYEAFSKCPNIKIDQLTLPESLINIGSNIFTTDKSLKEKVNTIICVNINEDCNAYDIGNFYYNEFSITKAFVFSDIYNKCSECFGFIDFTDQVDFQSIIMLKKNKTDICYWNIYPSIRYNTCIDEWDDYVYEYSSDDNDE